MKGSLQKKFLLMFIPVILITSVGISATYYWLTKRDKQRESRQRIQIAFDILLDSFTERAQRALQQTDEFLRVNNKIGNLLYLYKQDGAENSKRAIGIYLINIATELLQFAHITAPDRLLLYDSDNRLVLLYRHQDGRERIGGYVVSDTGQSAYLPLEDPEARGRLLLDTQIVDNPLPEEVAVQYDRPAPKSVTSELFRDGHQIGIRITSPVMMLGESFGVLISDVFYTQPFVERYAALTQTHINLFAGQQFSIGTLPDQTSLTTAPGQTPLVCDALQAHTQSIGITSLHIGKTAYYQGQCVFSSAQGDVGTLAVSLSHEIEQKAIAQIVKAVFLVAGITCVIGALLSMLISRPSIQAIHNMVTVISAVAAGDLRKTAVVSTHDELGVMAEKLNIMTEHLRALSVRVQEAARMVNQTADVILTQMDLLVQHTEQEAASVDNTTMSVEKIKQFIENVAHHTNDLLTGAAQNLVSIQETRFSISEVAVSTATLSTHLQRISESIEQVSLAIKEIASNTGQLASVAQQTESEIARVDQALHDVSQNADQSRRHAAETMNAAARGQASVEASIRGIAELKTVVGNTAQIIQEVNLWGEQVSSILGIVDDITEQTSLLSLNASIISAQAGVHGRGFAVVANEIKELAVRTKNSTREIGTLVRSLQAKTGDGVNNIAEGMKKADESVQLVQAVQDALKTILESATLTSKRATDTAQVMQHTANSSQKIRQSITAVTGMVSQIQLSVQAEEENLGEVVSGVDTIRDMAAHVNKANLEQKIAATQIADSMEAVTSQFTEIAMQTGELSLSSEQIVAAMHKIEDTTEKILQNTTQLSNHTVKNLLSESEALQNIVNIFKVA